MSRKQMTQKPLYVQLPMKSIENLHRAAVALGVHKKDLVASLVDRYVDPESKASMSSLMATRVEGSGPTLGSYAFQPFDPPEIMNATQAGQFLQLEEQLVIELAEAGELPGKRLGTLWRFSREALVAWLSKPEPR